MQDGKPAFGLGVEKLFIRSAGSFLRLALGFFLLFTECSLDSSEGQSYEEKPAITSEVMMSASPSRGPLFDLESMTWFRGVPDKKEVSLTFDDGPNGRTTSEILDVLKEKNVKATFFLVGKAVDLYPHLARAMKEQGHEIGNHSYTHARLDKLSLADIEYEMTRCQSSIERATGEPSSRLMRPPGMRFDGKVIEVNRRLNLTMIHWTVGAKDFLGWVPPSELPPELRRLTPPTPSQLCADVLKQIRSGDIILLHENPTTLAALPLIIDQIKNLGFEFRLSSEMMPHAIEQAKQKNTLLNR